MSTSSASLRASCAAASGSERPFMSREGRIKTSGKPAAVCRTGRAATWRCVTFVVVSCSLSFWAGSFLNYRLIPLKVELPEIRRLGGVAGKPTTPAHASAMKSRAGFFAPVHFRAPHEQKVKSFASIPRPLAVRSPVPALRVP
jgi:hypothetical protein